MMMKNPIEGIKIGDEIKNKNTKERGIIVEIGKSVKDNDGGYIAVDLVRDKDSLARFSTRAYWYGINIIIIKTEQNNPICICELDVLMARGCQCGGT